MDIAVSLNRDTMDNLQKQVRDFIKYDRSISAGKSLYNKLPNKSRAMQHNFNRMSNNARDVRVLCYELCKAVGLTTRQYDVLISQPLQFKGSINEIEVQEVVVAPKKKESNEYDLLNEDVQGMKYPTLKKLAKKVQTDMDLPDPKDLKKDTLVAMLLDAKKQLLKEVADQVPQPVKKAIALREQFPFLRDKTCPTELKALVNDLITARENYVAGHQQLFTAMSQEQEQQLAHDIVDNFIENKQAFAELEHYREFNKILGEHPSLKPIKLRRELEQLSTPELTKKVNSLRKNISSNKKKAEQLNDGDEKLSDISDRVADYELQLDIVQELLKAR